MLKVCGDAIALVGGGVARRLPFVAPPSPLMLPAPIRPLALEAPQQMRSLRAGMAHLLEASVISNAAHGDDLLYTKILDDLLPDEARIVARLSSGEVFAAADVVVKNGRREPERVVLRNISCIGRMAGIAAPLHTHRYLVRLADLGLVDIGAAGGAELNKQYEMLELDPVVQAAGNRARIVRTTVRISEFGRGFWAAVDPRRLA